MSDKKLKGVWDTIADIRIMLDGLFSEGDIHKACAFMEEMLQVFMSMFDI